MTRSLRPARPRRRSDSERCFMAGLYLICRIGRNPLDGLDRLEDLGRRMLDGFERLGRRGYATEQAAEILIQELRADIEQFGLIGPRV